MSRRRDRLFFLIGLLLSHFFVVSADGDADAEALIEKHVDSIIELKPAGIDFYTRSAKKVGKVGGAGCVLGALAAALIGTAAAGPLGTAIGAAKGCAGGGFTFGLFAALEAPFKHWGESAQAAYRARKAYLVSFGWLGIEAFDIVGAPLGKVHDLVKKHFRECAKKYHPDKLPPQATQTHKDNAAIKFANCKFAKAYIVAFQNKYGVLDPEDTGDAAREFLDKFAGSWAATFGTNEGIGSLDATQTAEWMSAIKNHAEL